MDLSDYTKRNSARSSNFEQRKRCCMECGRELEKDLYGLYGRMFCSEGCKDRYISGARELQEQ